MFYSRQKIRFRLAVRSSLQCVPHGTPQQIKNLETRCTYAIRRSCKTQQPPLNLFTIHAQEKSADNTVFRRGRLLTVNTGMNFALNLHFNCVLVVMKKKHFRIRKKVENENLRISEDDEVSCISSRKRIAGNSRDSTVHYSNNSMIR